MPSATDVVDLGKAEFLDNLPESIDQVITMNVIPYLFPL
jgi:hypothetical protein